jgi:hypothetical protein
LSDEQMPQPRRRQETIPESFSVQDVMKLLQTQQEQNAKLMMEFAKELKKPSDREQKELDEKDARIRQRQEAGIKLGKAEEQRRIMQRTNCNHATTHPGTGVTKHAWRSCGVQTPAGLDPSFTPICQQCQTTLPKIRATTEMVSQGVNLDMYAAIDMPTLLRWSEESWKGHEEGRDGRAA